VQLSKLSRAPLPQCMMGILYFLMQVGFMECMRFNMVVSQVSALCGFILLLLQQDLTLNAPASSVSQWRVCDFSAVQRGGGGRKLSCRTERQKGKKSASREGIREGMSNGRRLPNRKPGRERERVRVGVRESGSECIKVGHRLLIEIQWCG